MKPCVICGSPSGDVLCVIHIEEWMLSPEGSRAFGKFMKIAPFDVTEDKVDEFVPRVHIAETMFADFIRRRQAELLNGIRP